MPTRNVLYDRNALLKHRRHTAERDRLSLQLSSCNSSGSGRRLRSRTQAVHDAHHQASLETFRTRYATVQEYARWRFRQWAGGRKAPAVDFETLGSVEEVDRLYLRLQAEGCTAKVSGLPVCQLSGMPAFSDDDLQSSRHLKAGSVDAVPDLPDAGCDSRPTGPLPPDASRTIEQASKGMARRVLRTMAEPGLIAGAALVGALIGHYNYFHPGYSDHPTLGMAATMAGVATSAGLVRFVSRSRRAGTKMLGGFTTRVVVALLCLGFEFYGLGCVCDDVSPAVYSRTITFE
jgi:hypothetical protein